MTTYGLAALLFTLGVRIGSWFLYQSTGRGVGWMFVFFVVLAVALNYALTRTAWGRYVFAVGGNAEAARRAGINVKAVYTSVFVLCSTLAALGGILAASRLAASNQATGAGDLNLNAIAAAVIGGTSLFGGRGSAFSALRSHTARSRIVARYIVTGIVLLLAVALVSISRRSRGAHGLA